MTINYITTELSPNDQSLLPSLQYFLSDLDKDKDWNVYVKSPRFFPGLLVRVYEIEEETEVLYWTFEFDPQCIGCGPSWMPGCVDL